MPAAGRRALRATSCARYVDGEDPVNGGPFMQLRGRGADASRSTTRTSPACPSTARRRALLDADTEENLQRLFVDERWTDFLPIVLPTEERVEAMLAGTSRARDEVVGRLRPTAFREFWEFTVEKVAVNAVMAGAQPRVPAGHPAALASGMTGRSSSTTSFATIALVNGPIRNEIGMNSGIGDLRPVQPRQRDDRPRLQPGLAEPAGRLGPGRDLHGLAGQLLRLQRRRSPRTRSAARGRRSTSSTASSRPTAR